MAFDNLSERERQILQNLITYYITSADPVGSRVIANKFNMGLSSATIRNTLQDLEDLGLVEQPHTSAGRVPTDMGYRVYIDYLFKPDQLTDAEKKSIKSAILKEGRGINEILSQTARVLGEITNQLGVTISPRFEEGILRQLRLIPIAEGKVMVVVIVESGLARSVILEVETTLTDRGILEVESLLNERLCGLTLSEIRKSVSERLANITGAGRLLKVVIDSRQRIWSDERTEDIHYSGTDKLLSLPEFSDREKLSRLMKLLENGHVLSDFLSHATSNEGLVITIGRENTINEIVNCSLVSSSYRVGNISGAIGIIGPTRMPYSKLVSIVEYTAKSISEVLSGLQKEREERA